MPIALTMSKKYIYDIIMTTIDYLFEDPPISNQKFALVTIVGPHMPQKCDTWGLKVRGVASTLDEAKSMCQRLMRIDNNYDIYTVDVGKFFPLNVEPHDLNDVEYANTELNQLIKSYLENRQHATDQWHARKNEMIQKAVEEGKNQQELLQKPEHPISVLNRIKTYEEKIRSLQQDIKSTEQDLRLAKEKFDKFSHEEKDLAFNDVKDSAESIESIESSKSIDAIRSDLIKEVKDTDNTDKVSKTLQEIDVLQKQKSELETVISKVNRDYELFSFQKLSNEIDDITSKISKLKDTLNNSNIVNDYINSNYTNSPYNNL